MPARPQPATSHPRPVVGRVERFFASVALAAIAVAAAAVSVEIAARVYLVRFAPEWTFRKYASHAQMRERYGPNGSLYALHPYLGFVLASNYAQGSNRHNALGYRGEEIEQPKPAGVVRVVCIGGSTTYTTGVDDYEQSYPDQLERKLTALGYKVDVINAGVPGWSSWESLVNFQLRVLDLDPDLIVVYDALNDVGPRIVWPPTAYRGDNSGARKLDSVEPTLVRALSLSTAARFALVKFGYGASQIGQESIAPTADTFLGDEFDVQSWTASYPAGIFDDHPVAEMIRANPPVYFERNVENLIATARSRGIGVVLATFAHLSAIHHDRHSSWDSPEYWSAIAEHNDVLRAIAARANVPVLDLARELPQDPALYAPISREGLNFVDIYHVNAAGAERQAQLLAEFLHRRTLVVGRSPGPVVGQGREAGPDSARRP